MQYHHLYADDSGESHWREITVALHERNFAPPAKAIQLSEPEPATTMRFLRLAAGWNEPRHPSPAKQTLVCLRGHVRVTASDGEVRLIGPGDIWRMEDLRGRGHHTEVVGDEDFDAFVAQHG